MRALWIDEGAEPDVGRTLGRFRLNATTDPWPVRTEPGVGITKDIFEIAAIDRTKRTKEQQETLASLYRRIADANVNVNLTYVATNNRLVVGADNIQKVKEALTKEAAPAAARR